ncbi:MAG: hypothetical protein Q8Q20_01625 [bacterium]|nr:hypothetical protein [bacterium]
MNKSINSILAIIVLAIPAALIVIYGFYKDNSYDLQPNYISRNSSSEVRASFSDLQSVCDILTSKRWTYTRQNSSLLANEIASWSFDAEGGVEYRFFSDYEDTDVGRWYPLRIVTNLEAEVLLLMDPIDAVQATGVYSVKLDENGLNIDGAPFLGDERSIVDMEGCDFFRSQTSEDDYAAYEALTSQEWGNDEFTFAFSDQATYVQDQSNANFEGKWNITEVKEGEGTLTLDGWFEFDRNGNAIDQVDRRNGWARYRFNLSETSLSLELIEYKDNLVDTLPLVDQLGEAIVLTPQ